MRELRSERIMEDLFMDDLFKRYDMYTKRHDLLERDLKGLIDRYGTTAYEEETEEDETFYTTTIKTPTSAYAERTRKSKTATDRPSITKDDDGATVVYLPDQLVDDNGEVHDERGWTEL